MSICPLSVLLVQSALWSALSRVTILTVKDRSIKNQSGNVVHLEDNEHQAQHDAQQVGIVNSSGTISFVLLGDCFHNYHMYCLNVHLYPDEAPLLKF